MGGRSSKRVEPAGHFDQLESIMICELCHAESDGGGWNRDVIVANGSFGAVCPQCVGDIITCGCCGSHMTVQCTADIQGANFCPTCATDCTSDCDCCGDTFPSRRIYNMDDGDSLCSECHDDCRAEEQRNRALHGYGYSYDFTPLGLKKGKIVRANGHLNRVPWSRPRFYGVELEVECRRYAEPSDVADDIHPLAQDSGHELFIMKEDSSLNNGLEVVSQPCTLQLHQEQFPWKKIVDRLRSNGCRSHDTTTCGIHIHASKNGMSELESAKIDAFVHSQIGLLAKLGRRRYNDMCQEKTRMSEKKPRKRFRDSYAYNDRYYAVN